MLQADQVEYEWQTSERSADESFSMGDAVEDEKGCYACTVCTAAILYSENPIPSLNGPYVHNVYYMSTVLHYSFYAPF